MTLHTPRGLRVRIDIPTAFGLMARLERKVSPFRVLKTTEGLQCMPAMSAFATGLIAFATHLSPSATCAAVAFAYLSTSLMVRVSYRASSWVVWLGVLYSSVSGFGLLLAITVATSLATVGWQGLAAFFIGRLAAAIASTVIDVVQIRHRYALTGQALTPSELHFFNAYRIHAYRIGVSTDTDLNSRELHDSNWSPTFKRFARKWPQTISRSPASFSFSDRGEWRRAS